jgi:hypothetical protein
VAVASGPLVSGSRVFFFQSIFALSDLVAPVAVIVGDVFQVFIVQGVRLLALVLVADVVVGGFQCPVSGVGGCVFGRRRRRRRRRIEEDGFSCDRAPALSVGGRCHVRRRAGCRLPSPPPLPPWYS